MDANNTCKPLHRISKRNMVLMRIIPRCGCSWKKEARGATDGRTAHKERERERKKGEERKNVAQTSECLSRRVNDYNDG